jgi:hypothetical protein
MSCSHVPAWTRRQMTSRLRSRHPARGRFLATLAAVAALAASGYLGASAFADSGTTTTTTTGATTTTTVSSVPVPAPDPAPAHTHHPAAKPAPKHTAAKKSTPAPVVQSPVASTPSVAPVQPSLAPTHHKAVRKAVRHRRHTAKKRAAVKPASKSKAPVQAPATPRVQPAKPVSSTGGSIWSPLFLVTLAVLIAVVAMTVLRSRGSEDGTSRILRWLPFTRIFRRRPREVVAEVVHAPPPLAKPPAGLPAAPVAPPVGSAARRESVSTTFNPEILLRPSTTTTEASVSIEVQPYEKAAVVGDAPPGEAADEYTDGAAHASTDDLDDGGAAAFVPEPPPQHERCEIALWRGYAKARFFAKLTTGSGEYEYGVAESQPFRARRNGTVEQTQRAEAAHRSLVEFLTGEGWEQEENPDGAWYASRFWRPVAATEARPTDAATELVRS